MYCFLVCFLGASCLSCRQVAPGTELLLLISFLKENSSYTDLKLENHAKMMK